MISAHQAESDTRHLRHCSVVLSQLQIELFVHGEKQIKSRCRKKATTAQHFLHSISAAAGTAGISLLLHPCDHEPAAVLKINGRVHEHSLRLHFQEHFQPVLLDRCIPRLGIVGYVHSQRGASAAGNDENAYTGASTAVLVRDEFLELRYSTVCQTYHACLPSVMS